MAEITKVTTPMIPKENTSNKMKPVTDQAFDLTDPSKVYKTDSDSKAAGRQSESTNLLKESMGRPAIAPLLKDSGEMMQVLKKIAMLVEMGVSASDATKDVSARELLESLFVSQKDFGKVLLEQDKSSVLFKGEAFDILRDVQQKFSDIPKVRDAIANLLKIFDYNVNSQNSVKSILYSCNNILDYMFSKDRTQFSNYLNDLAHMLLPKEEAQAFSEGRSMSQAHNPAQTQNTAQQQAPAGGLPQQAQNAAQAQNPAQAQNAAQTQNSAQAQNPAQAQNAAQPQAPAGELPQQAQNPQQVQNQDAPKTQQQSQAQQLPEQARAESGQQPVNGEAYNRQSAGQQVNAHQAQSMPQVSPKEAAGLLKNNLLPLLGEIVVKYHQNEKIRDTVMVVVHNIVRVDQGTPDALKDAVGKLAKELREIANLPPSFERQLLEAVKSNMDDVKNTPNSVLSKLSDVVSQALTSPDANPAMVKQAENMLISMLQNQSTIMDILHFVMPFQTPQGQVFTELYVDPETDEKVGRQKGKSHKIFISVESEAHGSLELSFLETGEHVDFAMWCSDELVHSLSGLKRHLSDIMQSHGYTMNSFKIDEMKEQHSVAEVFPRLLEKKVGIDVQI